jgi:hypothetical protein
MISGNLYLFCESCVRHAPSEPGVYALYAGAELVYVGSTDDEKGETLRSRLREHWDHARYSEGVTHYRREVIKERPASRPWPAGWDPPQLPRRRTPKERQNEVIREFVVERGRVPTGNKKRTKVEPPG